MIDRAACIFAYNKNPILVVTSTGAATTKISATALNAVFEGDQGRLARDGPAQQAGSSPAPRQRRPFLLQQAWQSSLSAVR
jgi:hypothetical protein